MIFGESKVMTTLKEHIATCDERYKNIEKRLTSVESKIDEIHSTIDSFRDFLLKLAVKSFLGLVVTIAGAVFVIKM